MYPRDPRLPGPTEKTLMAKFVYFCIVVQWMSQCTTFLVGASGGAIK